MEITLNEKELVQYIEIFLKSKTIREIIIDLLREYESIDENIDESDSDDEEKILKMKIGKIDFKKKRGRPKKETKIDKPINNIVIEEEKIQLDI